MTPEIFLQAAVITFVGGVGLTAAVLTADRLLPEQFVRERHDLAFSAFLLVPLIFVLTFRAADVQLMPSLVQVSEPTGINIAASPLMTSTSNTSATPAESVSTMLPWPAILLTLWAVGSLLMFARLGAGLIQVHRLLSNTRSIQLPSTLRLSRTLPIRLSTETTSPMLVGYFNPVILVPEDFAIDDDARPVLEHEIAHAVRRDNWIALYLRVVTTLFWWNVPLYALRPVLIASREKLCDSRAVELTGAPQELARALLDTAVRALRKPAPALAATAHGAALADRIRRLTTPSGTRERRPAATLLVILPALSLAAVIATPQLGTAQQAETSLPGISSEESAFRERLYKAAYQGRVAIVRELVDAGSDPSAPAYGDGTPLMGAIRGGRNDVFDALLTMGADPNIASPGDGSALISAVREGQADMARRLLAAGADPDLAVPGDGAALISAAARGDINMIDLLLQADADVNVAIPRDGNPLIAASLRNRTEAVSRLLAAGADPNGYIYRDETPLINAAQAGHIAVAELLVAAGADVSLTVETPHHDAGGPYRSPLSEAERKGHTAMIDWLKARGAEHRPPAVD